jgi:hypothetical protein
MNDTTRLDVHPDVDAFVTAVRARFADLGEEEREELLGGLEADVSELVAERGSGALGDPVAYAAELRAAAGLPPVRPVRLLRRGTSPASVMDGARAWWDAVVTRPRLAPIWTVVAAMRPAWWLVRAWVAAALICLAVPGWYDYGLVLIPGVPPALALAVLGICAIGSALVGLGRAWPGSAPPGARGVAARVVLLALNGLAVAGLFVAVPSVENARWDGYDQAVEEMGSWRPVRGLVNDGSDVCNIAAYDAAGQPLQGVQLFDQRGRPLDVRCYGQARRTVPWMLGDVARWNVFPLGEVERPRGRNAPEDEEAAFPTLERPTVPVVTNPLVPTEAEAVGPTRERSERDQRDRERRSRP